MCNVKVETKEFYLKVWTMKSEIKFDFNVMV